MDLFFENARRIFETASAAEHASEVTILITAGGGMRILADSDWPLDRLLAHHGARSAYRVSNGRSGVAVDGRSCTAACRFETRAAQSPARALLGCA